MDTNLWNVSSLQCHYFFLIWMKFFLPLFYWLLIIHGEWLPTPFRFFKDFQKIFDYPKVVKCSPMFSSRNLVALTFMFKSMAHHRLIVWYSVRKGWVVFPSLIWSMLFQDIFLKTIFCSKCVDLAPSCKFNCPCNYDSISGLCSISFF